MSNKANILIADDDTGMTETLSDILTDLGHHVEIVNDGYKAIETVKAHPFDVILMDIKMPGLNGVETFKKIKNIQPKVAVMMMTAYSVEDLIAEALQEGAFGVMYKPIDIQKIVEFIERVEKGVLILVVDEDLPTCEDLVEALERKSYHVIRASDGQQALKIAQNREFDIVFIGAELPVINGLEVYLALRKINPAIKVIMTTSRPQETKKLIEQAIKQNAYAYIQKPFDSEKVTKIVEGVLAYR